ncbi:phage holin family protein [Paraneptunicella aestuarii]|uniref:phage holin family protein n=1 Tax=Paraneptunicella aestuarii TaxID=2831148 RepID=UPI001E2FAD9F|nr:phage holin family protein [Paraneptunicella aestuarii]UAA38211.1 phage holin family protein [Paraneptunicella aestuarii]
MPMNDPNNYNVLTYFWMLFIASWGGAVNYISRVKRGVVSKFSFLELMGELVISGFSGVLTFWLCEAMSVEPLFTAACVGIAGHAGGRTVYFLEQIMIKRLEKIAKKFD